MSTTSPSSDRWTPKLEGIQAVLELIQLFASSDNKKQHEAYVRQEKLQSNDDFAAYCARVFIEESKNVELRQSAGLMMKRCLQQKMAELPDPVIRACQEMLLKGVGDNDEAIRRTAST
ncbi:transportin, partial [Reticulomyxa filosa]